MNSIKLKVKDFILSIVYSELDQIEENTLIFKEGYLDSMGFLSLITFLDKEFNIVPKDEELVEENFESINAISKFLNDRIN